MLCDCENTLCSIRLLRRRPTYALMPIRKKLPARKSVTTGTEPEDLARVRVITQRERRTARRMRLRPTESDAVPISPARPHSFVIENPLLVYARGALRAPFTPAENPCS